jgi:cytoskeletal protein CcmA (bactofilin family)
MQPILPDIEITALLGHGTQFEGKLHFAGRVRIDGKFRGEIFGDGVIIIGEGAEVEARIEAATVIVNGGTVKGSIDALEAVELYVPAKVTGQLRAPEIFMDKGVRFSGECTITKR